MRLSESTFYLVICFIFISIFIYCYFLLFNYIFFAFSLTLNNKGTVTPLKWIPQTCAWEDFGFKCTKTARLNEFIVNCMFLSKTWFMQHSSRYFFLLKLALMWYVQCFNVFYHCHGELQCEFYRIYE